MIKNNLRIFSQNVRKNKVLTDIILETQKNSADIIFRSHLDPSYNAFPATQTPWETHSLAHLATQNGLCSSNRKQHKKAMQESPLMSTNALLEWDLLYNWIL